jgi:hypothetical protein
MHVPGLVPPPIHRPAVPALLLDDDAAGGGLLLLLELLPQAASNDATATAGMSFMI